jgi:ketosteroid isomerase-like protein
LTAAQARRVRSLRADGSRSAGRRLDVRVVLTWHVRGGKVVEVWDLTDDQYASDEFWS